MKYFGKETKVDYVYYKEFNMNKKEKIVVKPGERVKFGNNTYINSTKEVKYY